MIDGQHIDGETGLERRVLVEIIDHYLGDGVALDLDHHAGVLVGFITHGGDVRDDLLIHQRGNPLDQNSAVHVVRDFGDDNLLAPALHLLQANPAAHFQAAAAAGEIVLDSLQTKQHAAGGKIRPFHVRHQLREADTRIVNLRADAVNDLAEVVRRDVRGHADGNAGAAVDQEVRECGGEDSRLGLRLIVIGDEIDRFLLHVLHERGTQWRQARFGVPHGSRLISLDRTKVSLTVHQPLTHRPGLGHVDQRRINRLVAVRMVIAHGLPDDLGAFDVLAIGHHAQIVHGEKNPTLRRLQSIAHIRQRARNDDRHRVI